MKRIFDNVFGKRLKRRRVALGLSQKDVANLMSRASMFVPCTNRTNTVGAYELGVRNPQLNNLIVLCKVMSSVNPGDSAYDRQDREEWGRLYDLLVKFFPHLRSRKKVLNVCEEIQ